MTADTSDAERLANLRHEYALVQDDGWFRSHARNIVFLLRLLDARDARIKAALAERDRLAAALAQAEARNVELQRENKRLNSWIEAGEKHG